MNEWTSCWCYDTLIAWAARPDRCFGTPVGALALCWCFGTPVGALALLLVLRHFCYVGSHVLIGASALLLVLRHSCYVGRHVLIGA